MKPISTGIYTVGPARRVPRSRIWLQGSKLAAAGFKPGLAYTARWLKNGTLELLIGQDHGRADVEARTVSGKGDVPIIDITGARVRSAFPVEFVKVSFYAGRIVIREAS